jgi:hypothetical protein
VLGDYRYKRYSARIEIGLSRLLIASFILSDFSVTLGNTRGFGVLYGSVYCAMQEVGDGLPFTSGAMFNIAA